MTRVLLFRDFICPYAGKRLIRILFMTVTAYDSDSACLLKCNAPTHLAIAQSFYESAPSR